MKNNQKPSTNEEKNTGRQNRENTNIPERTNTSSEQMEDSDPPLTEEDLAENDLSIEEADQIEWDEPQND